MFPQRTPQAPPTSVPGPPRNIRGGIRGRDLGVRSCGLTLRANKEAFRSIRKARGLSQAELAEQLGKSQKFISYVESGKRSVEDYVFVGVAKVLGVPVEAIADVDEEEFPSNVRPLRPVDPWTTEDEDEVEGYPSGFTLSATKFTRAADSRGMRERITVSFPPDVYAYLYRTADRLPGISDASALIRWFVASGMIYLSEHITDPILTEKVLSEETLARAAEVSYDNAQKKEVVDNGKKTCDELIESQNWNALLKFVNEYADDAEGYAEPHQSRMLAVANAARETWRRNNPEGR